jgi:hypothetical protein
LKPTPRPARLAFLVGDLGPNQLSYLLRREARRLQEDPAHVADDLVVFAEDIVLPPTTPPFCVLDVAEAYDFGGVAVATSLSTAETLLGCVGPVAKFLYAWDLEWIRRPIPHARAAACYRGLPVVARCDDHRRALECAWNIEVAAVIDDGDLAAFFDLARGATP